VNKKISEEISQFRVPFKLPETVSAPPTRVETSQFPK